MIDIIIPTIDHPKYLDRALGSVERFCNLNQVSVYVINDNSKYVSHEYEKVINQHEKLTVHYIVSSASEGPGPSRNKGIRAGKGDYIVFLDCDDIFIDDVGKYCNEKYDFFTTRTNNPDNMFCSTDTSCPFSPIHGMGIKRAFLEKYNLYFPECKYGGEDTIFRGCCMMISSNYQQYQDSTYYSYQVRADSNFTHRRLRLPKYFSIDQEKEILANFHNTAWLAQFLYYLLSLPKTESLMTTTTWNDRLLEILSSLCGPDYESISEEGLFFIATIIKKFLNIDYITRQGFMKINFFSKRHILMLHLFNHYFSLDGGILIFLPNENYEEFFHINESLLPLIITKNFCSCRARFFHWHSSLNLWCNYYYNDIFN